MSRSVRLFTSHGTELYVDVAAGELRHGPAGVVPCNAALVVDDGDSQGRRLARLMHDDGGLRRPISCGFERSIVRGSGDDGPGTGVLLEVVALERGLLGLVWDGKFLMADPDGRMRLCAPACSTWEFLLASEAWDSGETVGESGERADWFGLVIDRPALAAFSARCREIQDPAGGFGRQHGATSHVGRAGHFPGSPVDPEKQSHEPATYDFTVDWFTNNAEVWDRLLDQLRPRRVIEVGSYEGRSACHLIERCGRWNPIDLVCIDSWQGGFEHRRETMGDVEQRFDRNIRVAAGKSTHPVSVRKIRKSSALALAELVAMEEPPVDLIYIDGSHHAPDVLLDALLAFRLIRVGGIMIFDDYLWSNDPKGEEDPFRMPKAAIDTFINLHIRQIEVVSGLPIYRKRCFQAAARSSTFGLT